MITFVAVDFDNTLVYPRGGKIKLFRLLQKYGISLSKVATIYERAKRESGLSVESLLRVAADYVSTPLDQDVVKKDIENWLTESVVCYRDAASSVASWKQAGIPVIIITVGAPEFQKMKIGLSGLPHDDIFVLDAVNKKSDVLRKLLEHYGSPSIFVDDKATELDAIRESGITTDKVITYRIRRKNSPYYGQKSLYEHQSISRLNDPRLMVHIDISKR